MSEKILNFEKKVIKYILDIKLEQRIRNMLGLINMEEDAIESFKKSNYLCTI